ncbi:MAG: AsmA-like C-terminal region-containing protein, partial [Pseudomonadales bacterium]
FEGVISVADMRKSLEAWGFASGLEGQDFEFQTEIQWPGSPLNISIEGITGVAEVEGGQGRIVQAQADAGALKLLGIFDFAEIAQRLSFDLSKILGEGHAFNSVTGSFAVASGRVEILDPVIIAGAGSQLTLAGEVDLITESLDNDLIFTLPLNKNLPWYAAYSAIVTGPLMGAGVLLAQQVFKNQIDELTSLKYEISGTLEKPEVKLVAIFDDSIRSQKTFQEETNAEQ